MIPLKSLNASDAREQLYSLIKTASKGLKGYEIQLRGSDSVVLISKAELDSWQETLDILMHANEVEGIRKARSEKNTISHKKLLKMLKIQDED